MNYIILISPGGVSFDEAQMEKALQVRDEVGTVDFILLAGWSIDSKKTGQLWQDQKVWLLSKGVENRYLVTPENMSWPGGVAVESYGKALSVFDQIICVSSLTTDDMFSKGELFFVGPDSLRDVTLELAKFCEIPRVPEAERCEYHSYGQLTLCEQLEVSVQKTLQLLKKYQEGILGCWHPKFLRNSTFSKLEKNCI